MGMMYRASPWLEKARLLESERLEMHRTRCFYSRMSQMRWPVFVQALSGSRMSLSLQEVSPRTGAWRRPSRSAEWYFRVAVSVSFVTEQYLALASDVVVMLWMRASTFS